MYWKSMKLLLASTATAALASQIAFKLYKKFTKGKCDPNVMSADEICTKLNNMKDWEINDVIMFSDIPSTQNVKISPGKEKKIDSRELNCFKLIRYIKAARETLDVCMYLLTSNEIAEHIIRLGQKHVLVRILVDSDMACTSGSQIQRLQQYSFIHVQTSKKSALMHHKFCIIDGPMAVKRKTKLINQAENLNVFGRKTFSFCKRNNDKKIKAFIMSGSLNWSTQAMVENHDNVVVTSNEVVVAKFEKEFGRLWMDSDNPLFTSYSIVSTLYYQWYHGQVVLIFSIFFYYGSALQYVPRCCRPSKVVNMMFINISRLKFMNETE